MYVPFAMRVTRKPRARLGNFRIVIILDTEQLRLISIVNHFHHEILRLRYRWAPFLLLGALPGQATSAKIT
jgi:hypothetical protein